MANSTKTKTKAYRGISQFVLKKTKQNKLCGYVNRYVTMSLVILCRKHNVVHCKTLHHVVQRHVML